MLPFPSKVVAKVINKQLRNHLEHHLLGILQSGFCSNHSTETALITVTDDIQTIMDKGETAVHIQLDLSAAFNTVSHSTLITRFHNSRVQGPTLRWLASFLSNRTQQVSLLPCTSSSLSPTLFNVYMAPLAHHHKIPRNQHCLLCRRHSAHPLPHRQKANHQDQRHQLHVKRSKLRQNWLKRNSDKTEVLLFKSSP